jgi:hypothetical protein
MNSINIYSVSIQEAISVLSNKKVLCEAGDRFFTAHCKKLNKDILYMDFNSLGCVDNNSICSIIEKFKWNKDVLIILNTVHSITGVHVDIVSIINLLVERKYKNVNILLYVSEQENIIKHDDYIKKILKICLNASSKKIFDCGVYIEACSTLITSKPLQCKSITKTSFMSYINTNPKVKSNVNNYIKYKQLFIEKLKKYMKVIPLIDYNSTYNESHTFISTVVFNNNIKNKWLSLSIISTKNNLNSCRLDLPKEFISSNDKSITFNSNLDKYVKKGFLKINFENISSISKVDNILKLFILSIEKIVPSFNEEIILYTKKISDTSHNKKVRFSTKLYYDDSTPSIKKGGANKYKNGKPIGVLKKKSKYV